MLVLNRKVGDRLFIGGAIVVTIVGTRGGSVRIGIEAPREVDVLREEIAPCVPPRPERLERGALEAWKPPFVSRNVE